MKGCKVSKLGLIEGMFEHLLNESTRPQISVNVALFNFINIKSERFASGGRGGSDRVPGGKPSAGGTADEGYGLVLR